MVKFEWPRIVHPKMKYAFGVYYFTTSLLNENNGNDPRRAKGAATRTECIQEKGMLHVACKKVEIYFPKIGFVDSK